MKKFFLLLTGILVLATGCAHRDTASADPSVALATQMAERLSVMEAVALYKYHHNRPVEDPEREAELLAELVGEGARLNLPPDVTRRFFEAQIEAAKIVQEERIRTWQAGSETTPKESPDLIKDIRPSLDRLSKEMLHSLSLVREKNRVPESERQRNIRRHLETAGHSEPAIAAALRGLFE